MITLCEHDLGEHVNPTTPLTMGCFKDNCVKDKSSLKCSKGGNVNEHVPPQNSIVVGKAKTS